MTKRKKGRWGLGLIALGLGSVLGASVAWAWPNAPGEDPLLDPPNDPGYINFGQDGEVLDGEWNFWSFTPEVWSDNPNFRQAEVEMGTGIAADKAWQHTTGNPQVLIAVLDSGARWGREDLINKYYLNRAELTGEKAPRTPEGYEGDSHDVNGDGVFNAKDYAHFFPEEGTRLDQVGNQNGRLDPQDLIRAFSDGTDDDANGYIDDISGWDFFWNDNDAHDDNDFGHGDGEARLCRRGRQRHRRHRRLPWVHGVDGPGGRLVRDGLQRFRRRRGVRGGLGREPDPRGARHGGQHPVLAAGHRVRLPQQRRGGGVSGG
jgi:hypothetical protein